MFTTSRTRTSQITKAAIGAALALCVSSFGLAKPKHDSNSRNGKNPDSISIDRGQSYSSDTGTTVRVDAQKSAKAKKGHGKKNDLDEVIFIDRGQSYSSDTGTTVRTDEQRSAKKAKKGHGKKNDLDNVIFIDRGQSYSSDTGTTVRADSVSTRAFLRSMDLTSATRTDRTASASSSRVRLTPVAPINATRSTRSGHGWMDVSADGENGASANGGWTWNLR